MQVADPGCLPTTIYVVQTVGTIVDEYSPELILSLGETSEGMQTHIFTSEDKNKAFNFNTAL
jgi:hypothetical protein